MIDAERDLDRIAGGEVEEILYEKITGIKLHSSDESDFNDDDESLDEESDEEFGDPLSDESDLIDDEAVTESMKKMSVSPEQAKLLAKTGSKLHKKKVKLENRERRKNKMPKAFES